MHGGDAVTAGVARAVERDLLSVHLDRARRRPVHAGEDPDERRLAGAIVAEEAEDLARMDIERDVMEDVDRHRTTC